MSSEPIIYYPLSYNQRSMWYLHRLAPESDAYNTLFSARICSALDVQALHHAFQALVDRHAVLRTTYALHHNEPIQQVHAHQAVDFTMVDAAAWHEDVLLAAVTQVARRPFDLAAGPVLRVHLFTRAAADHVLVIVIHHIAIDMSSYVDLVEQLGVAYQAAIVAPAESAQAVPPPAKQYSDYVQWQQDLLASARGERLHVYWHAQLAGELPVLDLPTDRPLPPVQQYHGASQNFQVNQELLQQVKALAKAEGTSVFTVLLAAFQVLLHRYSGQAELLTGVIVSARNRGEFQGMPGYCINPVTIRSPLSDNPTFKVFLAQVRDTLKAALQHQDYPFARLIEQLQPKRDASRPPIFQTTFNMLDARFHRGLADFFLPTDKPVHMNSGGLELEPFFVPQQEGGHFLSVELYETGDKLRGFFKYNADLFDASTITRMSGHYQTLLEGIVANDYLSAERPIAELPLLTAAERQQLLIEWNQTQTTDLPDKCIHQLFEEQVERTPDAVAVMLPGSHSAQGADQQLTYRALNERANQLAHYLQALGVAPESLVGIYVERSLEAIIGLLGILKAGGAYVPLDPTYPKARLAFMLADAQPLVLLTQAHLLPELSGLTTESANPKVVCLDTDWPHIVVAHKETTGHRLDGRDATPDNLAYVIYTSGSTGKPKGVLVAHRGLCNLALAEIERFAIQPTSRILQFVSLGFDVATSDWAMALCAGATLCLTPDDARLPGLSLLQVLRQQAITHIELPASVLAALPFAELPALQTIIVGGEACSPELVAKWAVGRRFFNAYGPTEATVCATLAECTPNGEKPTIGRPLANTQVYVLDTQRQLVPLGVPGELHIGGIGLARGYLNQPALTSERFIEWAVANSDLGLAGTDDSQMLKRLYKTGDLVRYLPAPDGGRPQIEFLGRIDHQVKVRGFRIELGEIEAVLAEYPGMRENVVIVCEDGVASTEAGPLGAGDKRLVAYVVMAGLRGKELGTKGQATALRDHLKTKLPDYMIPVAFVPLAALPLTPNGKIDRRALPVPNFARVVTTTESIARTATEKTLAALWAEVLGVKQVGRADNFFESGGHSLRAAQLIYRVQETFGVSLSIQRLFESPTVAGIAREIDQVRQSKRATNGTATMAHTRQPAPCLVGLQTNGLRPPFFCVHPIAGVVFPYYKLSALLGKDQPFYGLQSIGLAGQRPPLAHVEEMATNYIQAIRTVQPEGPYYLGGWSFGVQVAYEMAQQLQQAGQPMALLAMIDTPPYTALQFTDFANFFLNSVVPSIWPYVHDYFALFSQELQQLMGHDRGMLEPWLGTRRTREQTKAGITAKRYQSPEILRLLQIMLTNIQAGARYAPQPYAGQITLLRTGQTFGQSGRSPDLGWRALAKKVEIYRAPGHHLDMLQTPYVHVLAGQLRQRIDEGLRLFRHTFPKLERGIY